MGKRALMIGIDAYAVKPLAGCVNDAKAVASLLSTNEDGSPNFDGVCLTSDRGVVTAVAMHDAIERLFTGPAVDVALLYFAGHGIVNDVTSQGYLVSQDGERPRWGIPLPEILELANKAFPKIRSSVIILDSCQSGYAGEVSGLGSQSSVSMLANGVTILTACDRSGSAAEVGDHGLFTSLFLDALRGGAADVLGRITPASVYSHVDQTLGDWEARPVYKANVQTFVVLREVEARVPKETLRSLSFWFRNPGDILSLDPSYEPNRGAEAAKLSHIPVDQKHVVIYEALQRCNRHGLVEPVDQPHMWHAAVFSTGCRLTALGQHYHRLGRMERI